MWKHFFYFSKSERTATIVLILIIFVLILFLFLLPVFFSSSPGLDEEKLKRYYAFADSLEKQQPEKTPFRADLLPERFPFDPNVADSLTFLRLGLKSYQIRNILRYRLKGGTFRKKQDFAKIYGIDKEVVEQLLPYIRLPEKQEKDKPAFSRENYPSAPVPPYPRQEKYPPGTVIDLNLADTTELKKIPGIGSGIAKRIVQYRERLGGFYAVSQLLEVWSITPDNYQQFAPWFRVEEGRIRKLKINSLDVDELKKHPYINYYQAKAFVSIRRNKGHIMSLEQFSLLDEFSPEDLERLQYYIDFQ